MKTFFFNKWRENLFRESGHPLGLLQSAFLGIYPFDLIIDTDHISTTIFNFTFGIEKSLDEKMEFIHRNMWADWETSAPNPLVAIELTILGVDVIEILLYTWEVNITILNFWFGIEREE